MKRELEEYPVLPPFPRDTKKAASLLKGWARYQVVRLPFVELFLSPTNQKDAKLLSLPSEKRASP